MKTIFPELNALVASALVGWPAFGVNTESSFTVPSTISGSLPPPLALNTPCSVTERPEPTFTPPRVSAVAGGRVYAPGMESTMSLRMAASSAPPQLDYLVLKQRL